MWSAIIAVAQWLFKLIFNRTPAIVQIAKDDGAETQKVSDLQTALKTETAVASAEANAPSTVSGVEDRLAKGNF